MKNMKIEALIKKVNETTDNEEMRKLNAEYEGAWRLVKAYQESNEKGFDEIVITDCIFDSEVKNFIDAARQLGVGWFVYATGFSGAFETLDYFVQNGAKIGKFVVKEYTTRRYGQDEVVRVPGIRINL